MKIIHFCLASFYIDNYSYQENLLPKYHKILGHQVLVIASLQSFDQNGNTCYLKTASQYLSNDGYRVIRLKYKNFPKRLNMLLRRYQRVDELLISEKPDLLFIHGCQFLSIINIVKYISRFPHVKVFVDNHADENNSATNWLSRNILHKVLWKYCAKLILPYCDKFYGVTPTRCRFLNLMYKIPNENIELLVMGADDEYINNATRNNAREQIRQKLEIAENDFVIVSGGKIDQRKNIHILMQVFFEMKIDQAVLIVFGNANLQIMPIIQKYGSARNIRYLGWIDSNNTYDLFLASDLAIFPGTHSVLWEQAVGTGIPCIFKYWNGMTHVDVGGNCRFLQNADYNEIKDSLTYIINNPDEFKKMKSIAENKGKNTFSYLDIAKRSIKLKQ